MVKVSCSKTQVPQPDLDRNPHSDNTTIWVRCTRPLARTLHVWVITLVYCPLKLGYKISFKNMYTYMYVYIHVHVHTVHTCIHCTCTCMCVYVYMHVRVRVRVHACACTCMCVHMCVHMHVRAHACTCTCTYIYGFCRLHTLDNMKRDIACYKSTVRLTCHKHCFCHDNAHTIFLRLLLFCLQYDTTPNSTIRFKSLRN